MIIINLQKLREQKGLSQKEIALLLGIPPGTYSRYETLQVEPDIQLIKKISNLFNVSIDYLLGRTNFNTDIEITPEDLELLRQIKKASPEQRKAIEILLNLTEQKEAADK